MPGNINGECLEIKHIFYNRAIVLRFTNNKDAPGAIKLIKGTKEEFSNVQISAGAFFNHLEANLDDIAGQYEAESVQFGEEKGWVLFFEKVMK